MSGEITATIADVRLASERTFAQVIAVAVIQRISDSVDPGDAGARSAVSDGACTVWVLVSGSDAAAGAAALSASAGVSERGVSSEASCTDGSSGDATCVLALPLRFASHRFQIDQPPKTPPAVASTINPIDPQTDSAIPDLVGAVVPHQRHCPRELG